MGGKEDPPQQARWCCYAVARSQGEERRGRRRKRRRGEEGEGPGRLWGRPQPQCCAWRSAVFQRGGDATGERVGGWGGVERERGGA